MPTATTFANSEEWEWVDPRALVAVHELVRAVQDALASKATSSWSIERRRAVEDMLDRLTAVMRDLVRLARYEDWVGDARHIELLHRRLELLVSDGRDLIDLPTSTALASGPRLGGAADPRVESIIER
jgi:hypothetical protein